jgi:hypothetical protein
MHPPGNCRDTRHADSRVIGVACASASTCQNSVISSQAGGGAKETMSIFGRNGDTTDGERKGACGLSLQCRRKISGGGRTAGAKGGRLSRLRGRLRWGWGIESCFWMRRERMARARGRGRGALAMYWRDMAALFCFTFGAMCGLYCGRGVNRDVQAIAPLDERWRRLQENARRRMHR